MNTETLSAFNVSVTFLSPQFTTLTLPAKTAEEAKAKALDYLKQFPNVEIKEVYDISTVPSIEQAVKQQAAMMGVDIYSEPEDVEIIEPVHDPKSVN